MRDRGSAYYVTDDRRNPARGRIAAVPLRTGRNEGYPQWCECIGNRGMSTDVDGIGIGENRSTERIAGWCC